MLIHTHVYYSNRFEPGTLFPDTFRIDRNELLDVSPATIVNVKSLVKESPLGTNGSVATFPVSILSIAPSIGYTLLFIMVPSKDFNLNQSMDALGKYVSFDAPDYVLSVDYGTAPIDFIYGNMSDSLGVEMSLGFTSTANAILNSSHSITVI